MAIRSASARETPFAIRRNATGQSAAVRPAWPKFLGRQISVFQSGNRNPAGRMPVTLTVSSLYLNRRPMMFGSETNRLRQRSAEIITASLEPSRWAAESNGRPRTGRTPSISNSPGETYAVARADGPVPGSTTAVARSALSTASKAGWARHASHTAGDTASRPPCSLNITNRASRSDSRNGTGRSSSASTTANMAVVSPMATASIASAVTPGPERS